MFNQSKEGALLEWFNETGIFAATYHFSFTTILKVKGSKAKSALPKTISRRQRHIFFIILKNQNNGIEEYTFPNDLMKRTLFQPLMVIRLEPYLYEWH